MSVIADANKSKVEITADYLEVELNYHRMLDVGKKIAAFLGVSETTLVHAVNLLKERGHTVFYIPGDRNENIKPIKVLTKNDKMNFVYVMRNRDKIVVLGENDRKGKTYPLTAGEVATLGKDTNKIRASDKTDEEKEKLVKERAQKSVAKVKEREEKIKRAKALHNSAYSYKEIAEALGVAESTARTLVAADDEVITLHSLSSLTLRIREYKREGLSNVAIGDRLGISESTVRRRLKKPLTEEETFLELMMDELSNVRDEILQNVTDQPLFDTLFGVREMGEAWTLRVNTVKRNAAFTRRDGRGQRMTFALEFSAYRQPIAKE